MSRSLKSSKIASRRREARQIISRSVVKYRGALGGRRSGSMSRDSKPRCAARESSDSSWKDHEIARRSTDFDGCRAARETGSPVRHSQEEAGRVRPVRPASPATPWLPAPERPEAPPRMQHPGGHTRFAQQLRAAPFRADSVAPARVSPEDNSIPAIARSAITGSRD